MIAGVKCGMRGCQLALVFLLANLPVMAWAGNTVNDYIKNGLIAFWDGEYNQGTNNTHDSTASTWVDLSGVGHVATVSSAIPPQWGDNYLNTSNTVNGQTTLAGCMSFEPNEDFLSAINDVHFTYQICVKVNTWYSNTGFWGCRGSGGTWGLREGTGGRFAVRGDSETWLGSCKARWLDGCAHSVAFDGGYCTTVMDEAPLSGSVNVATTIGSSPTTGGGKIGGACARFTTNGDWRLYAGRVYNRALTSVEMAYNAAIDRVRYLGATPRTTVNVCAYSSAHVNYGKPSPSYDAFSTVAPGTVKQFSLTGVSAHPSDQVVAATISEDSRAAYLGATLTKISENGTETSTEYAIADRTFSVTADSDAFVVWKWDLQNRLLVTTSEGGFVRVGESLTEYTAYTNWYSAVAAESVTVTAVPAPGYAFSAWVGDFTGDQSAPTTTVSLSTAKALNASFVRRGKGDGSTYTWTGGAATQNWTDGANWDRGMPPLEGDRAVLASAVDNVVLVGSSPPHLLSIVIGGGEGTTTVKMQNWETKFEAVDITVTNRGVLTCCGPFNDGEMSNRVHLVCTNFTLYSGGKIDVNGLGYGWTTSASSWSTPGCGPGKGNSGGCGAAHGGRGGRGEVATFAEVNDSLTAPTVPGSSAGGNANQRGMSGGGAVCIEATGAVRLWGKVNADGVQSTSCYCGSGAGGSVYVACQTFDGTNVISALGGTSYGNESGGGGGGRIAIVYNTAAQAAANLHPTPHLQAGCDRKGDAYVIPPDYATVRSRDDNYCMRGEPGTVYLADDSFYPGSIWTDCSGYVTAPGAVGSSVDVDSLTFKAETVDNDLNGRRPILRDATVSIPGAVRIEGGTSLVFSNCAVSVGSLTVTNGYFELLGNSTLTVACDLVIAGSGAATFAAGSTNGVEAATWRDFGQRISIGGAIIVKDTAKMYVQSDKIRGGSPYFTAGSLLVDDGATISGYARGWGLDELYEVGNGGPGMRSDNWCGGAYGGSGGGGGQNENTYGDPNNPTDPGSCGGNAVSFGGWGGGLFWAVIAGKATVNGTIDVDGGASLGEGIVGGSTYGGGSGGGVNLCCGSLAGTGLISARGGTAGTGGSAKTKAGCGGGGRIFVKCHNAEQWTGTMTAAAGDNGFQYDYAASDGSVKMKRVNGFCIFIR